MNKKYSAILNEIIDPSIFAAGVVALAQKVKDKIFGPSEKTNSNKDSKDSKDLKDDKEPKKQSSNSDSKQKYFKEFEMAGNLKTPNITLEKVFKYIYLKKAKEYKINPSNWEPQTYYSIFENEMEKLNKFLYPALYREWEELNENVRKERIGKALKELKKDIELDYQQIDSANKISKFI